MGGGGHVCKKVSGRRKKALPQFICTPSYRHRFRRQLNRPTDARTDRKLGLTLFSLAFFNSDLNSTGSRLATEGDLERVHTRESLRPPDPASTWSFGSTSLPSLTPSSPSTAGVSSPSRPTSATSLSSSSLPFSS